MPRAVSNTFKKLRTYGWHVFENSATSQPDEVGLPAGFIVEGVRIHEKVTLADCEVFWSEVILPAAFPRERVNAKDMPRFPSDWALEYLQ